MWKQDSVEHLIWVRITTPPHVAGCQQNQADARLRSRVTHRGRERLAERRLPSASGSLRPVAVEPSQVWPVLSVSGVRVSGYFPSKAPQPLPSYHLESTATCRSCGSLAHFVYTGPALTACPRSPLAITPRDHRSSAPRPHFPGRLPPHASTHEAATVCAPQQHRSHRGRARAA